MFYGAAVFYPPKCPERAAGNAHVEIIIIQGSYDKLLKVVVK